jgi:integrase
VWNPSQIRTFLISVQRDRFAALFLLELTTGIRPGQICGLKWSAVDLDAGEITVHDNRVVVRGHAQDKAGGKTRNADKTISIDRTTLAALRRWRERQNGERELLGATSYPRRLRLHLRGRSPTASGHHPTAVRPPGCSCWAFTDHIP